MFNIFVIPTTNAAMNPLSTCGYLNIVFQKNVLNIPTTNAPVGCCGHGSSASQSGVAVAVTSWEPAFRQEAGLTPVQQQMPAV